MDTNPSMATILERDIRIEFDSDEQLDLCEAYDVTITITPRPPTVDPATVQESPAAYPKR